MTLLFSNKTKLRDIVVDVASKAYEHGFNLGKFVLIYKAIIGLSCLDAASSAGSAASAGAGAAGAGAAGGAGSTLLGRPVHPLHAMLAGAVGACVVASSGRLAVMMRLGLRGTAIIYYIAKHNTVIRLLVADGPQH